MYSSIELTHAQFVRDLSAAVEKDTLINCCHVRRQDVPSFSSDTRGGREATFRVLLEGYCFVLASVFSLFYVLDQKGPGRVPVFYFLHLTTAGARR